MPTHTRYIICVTGCKNIVCSHRVAHTGRVILTPYQAHCYRTVPRISPGLDPIWHAAGWCTNVISPPQEPPEAESAKRHCNQVYCRGCTLYSLQPVAYRLPPLVSSVSGSQCNLLLNSCGLCHSERVRAIIPYRYVCTRYQLPHV